MNLKSCPSSTNDKRQTTNARSAFTLFELLIATAIVGLILACVIPYIMSKQELSRRIECMQNLSLIRNAMNLYVGAHRSYPRVRYNPDTMAEGWTAFTGADDANPFAAASAVKPNDVTASLWLLVREGYLSDTSTFVCPSSDDYADRLYDAKGEKTSAKQRGNFRNGRMLSYSMFCPFGSAIGPADKSVWTDTLQSGCALLADKNPGVENGSDVTKPGINEIPENYAVSNSLNHGRAGQNVLYADGSVQFERNPYVGVGYERTKNPVAWGDNIYTALRATPIPAGEKPAANGNGVLSKTVSPAWPYDSLLVPTAAE